MLGVILAVLLAVSMLPAAGLASAFADEPVARPETVDGDVALEGTSGTSAVAGQTRDDGMVVADGLVYTVTDGGLSLAGFDGLPQGEDAPKEIVVPEAVTVDGKDAPVAAVAIAEGNVAESVISLTLPQSINDVDTATLAASFPNLASVEVASPKASSTPVAAGAAAMKAAYSSFSGILYKNVRHASDGDASQTALVKELVWAPPATVVARIPVECTSIAPGAFADCANLKTVVCFGVMESIAQTQKSEDGTVTPGSFTDEQIATVDVIVPQTGTVVPDSDGDRVSADVAVTDDSTMDIKRSAWWQSGFASDRITLGEVYGSTTNALPVTENGVLETTEAEVAYAPETTQNSSSRKAGIEPPESAIPTPVPDDDQIDPSESGLVFTHLADMTLSVSWKGDPTATPTHIDIPAYATINGVAYPVAEIAPRAFEGAVFLTGVTIPEGVTTIGDSAFAGCSNLVDAQFPATLKSIAADAIDGIGVPASELSGASSQKGALATDGSSDGSRRDAALPYTASLGGDDASEDATVLPGPDAVSTAATSILSDDNGEWTLPGVDELAPSHNDSISSYSNVLTTEKSITLKTVYVDDSGEHYCYDALPDTANREYYFTWTKNSSDRGTVTWTDSEQLAGFGAGFNNAGHIVISPLRANGVARIGELVLKLKNGWMVTSVRAAESNTLQVYVSKAQTTSVSWGNIEGKPSTFTPSAHNHTMANITDLKKYGKSDNVAWADVTGKPTLGTLASKNSVAWSEVTGKPSTFTPSSHTHTIANVTGLQSALDGKAAANHTHDMSAYVTKSDLDAKGYITKSVNNLDNYYTKTDSDGRFAPKSHTHDDRYYTEGEIDGKVSILTGAIDQEAEDRTAADDAVRTDVEAKDAATNARVDAVEASFGEIAYAGMEEAADAGVYPTSYRAGGTPSLHAPEREGWDFAGWEWSRTVREGHAGDAAGSMAGTSGTTDAAALAEAFAEPGLVTLTATWAQEAPKGTYFFTEEDPLTKAGPAPQEHVIKVVMTRTRSYPVDSVQFSWDNWTGLIAEGASITFTVGTDYDEATGEIKNGRSCTLARDAAGANRASIEGLNMVPVQFASRQCGLYVGISVPDGAVDKVVESYTEGSYVDSLVKMSYALAG